MKVLVTCEYSGIVRDAFLILGHDAYSNDLLPTESKLSAGRHLQCDFKEAIMSRAWDIIIAHPPCTYVCKAGLNWLEREPGRKEKMFAAIEDIKFILNAPCPSICVENPTGVLPAYIGKYQQLIYPYMFGDNYRKDICLWLKGLPPLLHFGYDQQPGTKRMSNHVNSRMSQVLKSKIKSKFFPGIAHAMATQWGGVVPWTEVQNEFSPGDKGFFSIGLSSRPCVNQKQA